MVYFFKAAVKCGSEYDEFSLGDEAAERTIFMGKDKFENEPLIKHSHPKNLWFHVDKHSSAHLYLQLSAEEQQVKFEDLKLDDQLLQQLGQLTKANSIKANKLNNITVIYTPVDNLRSDGLTDIGTVTFVNGQKLKRIHIAKRDNAVVNQLNRTKHEVPLETFVKEQADQLNAWTQQQKARVRRQEQEAKEEAKMRQHQKKLNQDPYADMFTEENLKASSNEFRNENWVEDEFW